MPSVTIGEAAEQDLRSMSVGDREAVMDVLELLPEGRAGLIEKLQDDPVVCRIRCPGGFVAVFTKADSEFHILNIRGRDSPYNELDTLHSGLGSRLLTAKRMVEVIVANQEATGIARRA